MKLEFSAGGIIFKKSGKSYYFALILDSYNRWTFPKGQIEKGENPQIAAVREISEEIGITNLRIIKLLDKINYWYRLNNELYHKYVYFFLMEAPENSQLIPQKQEIKDARWCLPQKALKIIDYKKDNLSLLKKAFALMGILV